MRNSIGGFILGILVSVLSVVVLVRTAPHKEEELPSENKVRYIETLKHPDEGSKLVLFEATMWDRPTDSYYISVLLSDWTACYVAPARVYRAPSAEAAKKSWLNKAREEVENAVQCRFLQNPVGFGSITDKKK